MTKKRVKYIRSTKDWMRQVREFHGNKFDGVDETTWHCGEDEVEDFARILKEAGCPYKMWFRIEYLKRRD